MLHRKIRLGFILFSAIALTSPTASSHGDHDNDHDDHSAIHSLTVRADIPAPEEEEEEHNTIAEEPAIDHPYYLKLESSVSSPSVRMFTEQDSNEVTKQKIKDFDKNLATLSPTILYYAANSLISKGYNTKAATYYVLAELRQNFDKRRFVIDKKSAGYFAQQKVGKTAYYRINPWLSHSTDRMVAIYEQVKYLDTITPIHYHPGYNVTEETDIKKWPQIHEKTRQDYFQKFDKYLTQIQQYNKTR